MRSKLKLVVSCVACFILALNSIFSPTKLFRRRFNLYTSDVRRLDDTLYTSYERLYDLSCPVSTRKYIGIGPYPVEANLYSVESGVLPIVHGAFQGKVHRKIVLVGDSITRQVFMSMSCVTHTLGIWKDDDAYTAAFVRGKRDQMFNDARVMLKNDMGELFLSPTAGKVNVYGWKGEQDAIEGNEDWLKSCHERKPFYLDTLSYHAQNKQAFFSPNDDTFEKVALDEEDVVFFNAGLHPKSMSKNKSNLVELLNCMQDAREKGFHVNWPRFYYVRTNVEHFHERDGLYTGIESQRKSCLERVDAQANPHFIEDKKIFTGKLPLVGFDTDFSEVGSFHVGGERRTDCTHWTMPGVPDVFARDIAKELLKLNELN